MTKLSLTKLEKQGMINLGILLIAILFVCILVAYSSSSSKEFDINRDPQKWTFSQKAELRRNQQKWADANISHYRFNYSVGCFCADSPGYTIEVQDGVVVSVTHSDGSAITGQTPSVTIDGLFSTLQPDARKAVDEITVTYDPIYGFPATIFVNAYKNIYDDEYTYYVSRFEVLP